MAYRKKTHKRLKYAILIIIGCIAASYLLFVYSPIPFIRKWRNIYIETAMTTNSHKWLATMFIPHSIIDEVMGERDVEEAEQKTLESTWDENTDSLSEISSSSEEIEDDTDKKTFFEKYPELDSTSFHEYLSSNSYLLSNGYNSIVMDNLSYSTPLTTSQGDQILAVDAPNNTLIIGVKGDGYVGKLAIVKDTDQVSVETSAKIGSFGETAGVYSERYNAEVVINASAFRDAGGHGSGGLIRGACVHNGKETGDPDYSFWKFVGVKNDGRMYISNYYSTDISDYRWGLEFYPALIVDGENVVDGTYGMGIQPRTAIGQTRSGDFMMLIIDGRQVGYSLGCTVSDCEKILSRYNAYQAFNLDGGSSSVMYYRGELITKPSSVSALGRFLPNALVVHKVSS